MTRPVLIGEANPYGADPEFAMYPAPEGSSGHRLCTLVLGMHRGAYLRAFERMNLCPQVWSTRTAKQGIHALLQRPGHCRFVLLGNKVCRAFGVPFEPFSRPSVSSRHQALVMPHPSGLCRLWNVPGYFLKTRAAVLEFAPELSADLGTYTEEFGGG